MTTIQKKAVLGQTNPIAHLTEADIEQIGIELDAIRQDVLDSRGASDAAYIRRVIDTQRKIELGSRAVLLFSAFPPAWVLGTLGLSISKILDNMEIGHNILHGQWDWMRDPKIHSSTWEWDMASPAEQWKHSHNELHHTYTNVIGKDNDLGYGIMRVDEDQTWTPASLAQPLFCFINAVFFEYGIAAYDLELGAVIAKKQTKDPEFRRRAKQVLGKIRKQATKDYVVHPALSIPTGSFLPTLAANVTANIVRNLWSNSVILCGHFPEGVETFEKRSIEGETKGEWYVRQMLGSANISGSKALHLMTGNLSHQIEHHLFPDLPSNRYGEIAPKVQALFEKYDLTYCARPMVPQVASAWHKVIRLSLPNGWLATTNKKNAPAAARHPLQDGHRRPPHPAPARPQARERGSGSRLTPASVDPDNPENPSQEGFSAISACCGGVGQPPSTPLGGGFNHSASAAEARALAFRRMQPGGLPKRGLSLRALLRPVLTALLVVLVSVSGLAAVPAFAAGTGTISGTVTDQHGGPAQGVSVRAGLVTGTVDGPIVSTGADGWYELTGVPDGTFHVAFATMQAGELKGSYYSNALTVRTRHRSRSSVGVPRPGSTRSSTSAPALPAR